MNVRQMTSKNRPEYLFNDNLIVNVKDFDSSLLKIYKLSYKRVFSLHIYYMKCISTKNLDHNNDDKDYLYLSLDDVDGYIEENDEIKYLAFTPTEKKQRSIKKLLKTLGKT